MAKRFNIETSTSDKEFVFISETIGSRLVAVTTADSAEVEVEIVKGKDKSRKTVTLNLEELVDVKGWKALGNRLSEFKVTKVSLVQDEEPGYEEPAGDDEEAAESENDSQSPKKKIESSFPEQRPEPEVGEDGQAILFAEPEKPQHQLPKRPAPKRKVKVEQQNLFGESPESLQKSSPGQKNESEGQDEIMQKTQFPDLGEENAKNGGNVPKNDGKSFNVGETIEFEL